jgi:hypothetical protein
VSNDSETNGAGGNGIPTFDHTELEVIGRALADAGRGLVSFGAEYPYFDQAEREIRRQRFGRVVALINSLWPQVDAKIKADKRRPITSHERDAHLYHIDRLAQAFDIISGKPKKD